MIKQISVQNFKSIRSAEVALQGINLLVGPNGAGKSNFLEVFELVEAWRNGQTTAPSTPLKYRPIGEQTLDVKLKITTDGDQQIPINLVSQKNENGQPTGKVAIHADKTAEEAGFLAEDIILYHFNPKEENRDELVNPITAKQQKRLLTKNGKGLSNALYRLKEDDRDEYHQITDNLTWIFPDLGDIEFLPVQSSKAEGEAQAQANGSDGSTLLTMLFSEIRTNNQRVEWDKSHLSDGTWHYLQILTALSLNQNSLIIIEEPENFLHPWLIRQVVRFARKRVKEAGLQVIFSTHSPILLDSVFPAEVLCAYQNQEWGTSVQPLVELHENLQEDYENGKYEISTLFDSGLIPTVPIF